jgi:hypothetical protein
VILKGPRTQEESLQRSEVEQYVRGLEAFYSFLHVVLVIQTWFINIRFISRSEWTAKRVVRVISGVEQKWKVVFHTSMQEQFGCIHD